MNVRSKSRKSNRRAATHILSVFVLVVLLGMLACALDLGHLMLLRSQLQVAADSAAVAAAKTLGNDLSEIVTAAGGKAGAIDSGEVELGLWDPETSKFTASSAGNAVRVTTRRDPSIAGKSRLSLAAVFGKSFGMAASAVAMVTPRDIALVVDLSGSMNDDTEPCWATGEINDSFASAACPTIGDELMQQLYSDFGFAAYPGVVEHLGIRWGVPQDKYAYARLTENGGPLTASSVPAKYRIKSTDDEIARKKKAYSVIIDRQIAAVMPNAKPVADSANNYVYWEKYLDYIVHRVKIEPPPVTEDPDGSPDNRGWIPPNQDADQIDKFNNGTFADTPDAAPENFRNKIGYVTYVQFMMDHGRDLRPAANLYVPLSRHSEFCPRHSEETPGGRFDFPPRSQPMHAVRRALIAVLQVIKQRNRGITDSKLADWVSIITFDSLAGGEPVIRQPLTTDYDAAMLSCTNLQAVGDKGATTATEAGLETARSHVKPAAEGGHGRSLSDKVVVLLTDGVPTAYSSSPAAINDFLGKNPSSDFYGNNAHCLDASLMQVAMMARECWQVVPVGIGTKTDYDFMDRMSRTAGIASQDGLGIRGSGNPAEYEQRLTDILEAIIAKPQIKLVQ